MSASINKMDLLISGLLRLSRLGSSELEIEGLDMNRLISEVSSIFKSRISNSDIKLEISELPICKGDEILMNQIFSNLIDNSIKYLDLNQAGIISISGYSKDGQSVYCVKDNGIGFDSEYKKKIFDIFHRLEPEKYSGEGLGLTIVQRALERQNGRIWVESEPGKGSEFYMSLPEA
jgi:light-regulated signal transduction histidine kinase (bacteriophytochrome)